PRAEHASRLVSQFAYAGAARVARITKVGFGILAGEGAHRGYHTAVVLHVVVTIEDVVLTVVLVLHGNGHLCKARLAFAGRRGTVRRPGVAVAAPGHVDSSEVLVTAPVAFVEQWQDASPIRAGFRPEYAVQTAYPRLGRGHTIGGICGAIGQIMLAYEVLVEG